MKHAAISQDAWHGTVSDEFRPLRAINLADKVQEALIYFEGHDEQGTTGRPTTFTKMCRIQHTMLQRILYPTMQCPLTDIPFPI